MRCFKEMKRIYEILKLDFVFLFFQQKEGTWPSENKRPKNEKKKMKVFLPFLCWHIEMDARSDATQTDASNPMETDIQDLASLFSCLLCTIFSTLEHGYGDRGRHYCFAIVLSLRLNKTKGIRNNARKSKSKQNKKEDKFHPIAASSCPSLIVNARRVCVCVVCVMVSSIGLRSRPQIC